MFKFKRRSNKHTQPLMKVSVPSITYAPQSARGLWMLVDFFNTINNISVFQMISTMSASLCILTEIISLFIKIRDKFKISTNRKRADTILFYFFAKALSCHFLI